MSDQKPQITKKADNPSKTHNDGSINPSANTTLSSSEIEEPPTSTHTANSKIEDKHWLDYVTASLALIAAIAATLLGSYQGWVARDTEKRQLRAYMVLTDLGVFCPDCGDKSLVTDILPNIKNSMRTRLENNGQTPAREVNGITNWWSIQGNGASLPADFAFPDHARTGFVSNSEIGKDKHKDSAEEFDQSAIATFKDAVDGRITLFIYGHVDYCDIFREPHSAAYCFVYVQNGGLHLPLCDRYNGEIVPKSKCQE
jgi:hypothetical protein